MSEKVFVLRDLQTECMINPLGIDCKKPRFSWRMECYCAAREQASWRIVVTDSKAEKCMWESGWLASCKSTEIEYEGEQLKPCTRYSWQVFVIDTTGNAACGAALFETGLMCMEMTAWEGGRWITAAETPLCPETKSVFVLEAEFRIMPGGKAAGIVFGAQDSRLLTSFRNTYGLCGENYISYELDISAIPAMLNIYRVGYHPDDKADSPFASIPVKHFEDERVLPITKKNRYQYHILRVEVLGNQAVTYVNGICVDGCHRENIGGISLEGRQLNPLNLHDVITFPRLNNIGLVAEQKTIALFKRLSVYDLRTPKTLLFEETAARANSLFEQLPRRKEGVVLCAENRRNIVLTTPEHGAIPMLRTKFTVRADRKIETARLYVTSRGIFEEWINGSRACDSYFQPDASQFDKRLYYRTFDLTDKIVAGENAAGFYLASGWWSDSQTFTLENHNYFGYKPSLLAKIVVTYQDGSRELIVTDTVRWKSSSDGPVRYAGFFHGEHYDARLEPTYKGFSQPDYDDAQWEEPVELAPEAVPVEEQFPLWPAPNHSTPIYSGHIGSTVRCVAIQKARACSQPRPGVFIYDLGCNVVGVPSVRLKEKSGVKVVLRYGEMLYPDILQYEPLQNMLLTENLRDADCTDVYICRGGESGEIYSPRFTFHGCRYIEITGVQNPPDNHDVTFYVLSSLQKETADFYCSDELVNKLYENIRRSQTANFLSIPTDCPQRNERMGWLGDAHVFAPTALYNDADTRLLLCRFLDAIRDLQSSDGRYPNIAPFGGGFGGIAWECAGIFLPWYLYEQFEDVHTARENYPAMKRYLQYLLRHMKAGLLTSVGYLGDWLATGNTTDNDLIWNVLGARCFHNMSKMAAALGYRAEAVRYLRIYIDMKEAWNQRFIASETGKTITADGCPVDTQCSYALPLFYNLVNASNAKKVGAHLNRTVLEADYTLTTGFLGTGCICQALTQAGYAKTAVALLRQTKAPSWLYCVTQGATSIWERWDSYTATNGFGGNNSMNSFNHYSFGAVGAWLIGGILGIRHREENAGYQNFIIAPQIGSFDCAGGFYCSPFGKIECSWRQAGSDISLRVSVPPNTRATMIVGSEYSLVGEAGRRNAENEIDLKSGDHTFFVRRDRKC